MLYAVIMSIYESMDPRQGSTQLFNSCNENSIYSIAFSVVVRSPTSVQGLNDVYRHLWGFKS